MQCLITSSFGLRIKICLAVSIGFLKFSSLPSSAVRTQHTNKNSKKAATVYVMGSPPSGNLMLSQYQFVQFTHVTELIMAYHPISFVKICYWEIAIFKEQSQELRKVFC